MPSFQKRSPIEVGFAINVEGVLIHKSKVLPFAKEALTYLQSRKHNFVLFGDGNRAQTEEELSIELQLLTGVTISPQNIVFPYSAFKLLIKEIPRLATQNVLVVGSPINRIKKIANSYGFHRVFGPLDIQHHRDLQIDAILVFNTPVNWDEDLHTVIEMLSSRAGYVHTTSQLNGLEELPNSGYCQDCQPTIHWCDMKLSHNSGDVTFKQAVEAAWSNRTGGADILGSWTEPLLPFVEVQCFENIDIPKKRTAYLIGGTSAKSPLDQLGDFGSRNGIDWNSILVITKLKRRMYKQPIVPVPNIGVGMLWAFEDAGFERAALEIVSHPGFTAPEGLINFQVDMPTLKPTDIHPALRNDLNKPLPNLPHENVRVRDPILQAEKISVGQVHNFTVTPASYSHSNSAAHRSFSAQQYENPPAIPTRSPLRLSSDIYSQWSYENRLHLNIECALRSRAQATDDKNSALLQAVATAHDRHLARAKTVHESRVRDRIAIRESTRRRLERATSVHAPKGNFF
ncbi:hypothetical protein GLAREA_11140 [Glarea lozoyensis ATCC 20868]|uniref:HAD-like protein n=1 Tax=Glarea lozoyensis (strain ATCC 20868 / MF5171) TaxID=1116229 RepID=S3DU18_GLAL2|nr:uncharacterized protein GLAREA_11140 [Glarea lozoyensis ATCC 20868]EPE35441.1 hypothetical protein GLAREA_11140 [Glarea lozoyensis ATCC 20868]